MKGYRCMVCGKVVADNFGNIISKHPVAWDTTNDGFPIYAHEMCMENYVPQINYNYEQVNYLMPWVVN